MVECGDEAELAREQHAVAEHIAGHVADADHRERVDVGVDTELAEVRTHRFPRAASRDAHRLVVVARATAGRERVAQPETSGHRDLVGGVGERGGALIGRDHEVRVVAVVAHNAVGRSRHRRGVLRRAGWRDVVVGDIEQAADERAVAVGAFSEPRVAVGDRRQPFGHEAALRARWHDHRVLHRLCLDETEHLGAEVLAAVTPAQAAPGDLAHTKVYGFHPR